MADLRLNIQANTRQPQQQIDALRRELATLREQLGQTDRSADRAGQAVDRLGDEARQAATGVTALGRSIFNTSAEAKRFDGVFRSTNGRLREANGRYVKGREAVEGLGRSFGGATGGAQTFTRSLGGLGNILGGLGIAVVGAQLTQFATASVSAAARLEGFERGLRLIEGTNAPQRLEELIEVANLPGLNLTDLIQYSNRLRTLGLTAAETDTLLISTGQAITAFGGTAHTAAEATEQIIQAISSGTVSLQDFRSIAQRVPGFYMAIADVHGVSANIDGLRTAVENAGGSIKDALIPVMEELAVRFAAPPPESYAASIDALQNSFFLLQAEIGSRLLPVVGESVRALSILFDALRENDLDALPEPIQEIVRGMQSLFAGFVSVGESIRSGLGPELDLLLPAIGNLLGDILSLAGALLNGLAPAYEILAVPTRVAIALIVHLADTVGSVIGAITDFVDWVTGAAASQEELQTATAATARAIGEASASLNEGSTSTERFQANIKDLQTELDSVNQALAAKRQQLTELAKTITSEAHPSFQNLERGVTRLEGEAATLTAQIGKTQASLDGQTKSTEATTAATKAAAVEFITYAEAIRQVQANVQAYVEEQALFADFGDFWRVASGQASEYSTAIDFTTASVVNLKNELDALTTVFNENNVVINENGVVLDEETRALLRYLATLDALDESLANAERRTDAHNAALVNPAVSDAVRSLRDYNDVLSETGVNFETVDSLSDRLTSSIREQASAFDALARSAGRAATAQEGTPRHLQNQLPGQVIGSDVFTRADVRTPGFTQGVGFNDPRIIGGDNTFDNNLQALGRNLETFTEGFTVNVGDIVSAIEGGISPLDAFERSLTQLHPALGVFTTTIRLLIEEIDEADRRREEFRRTRDLTETQRGTFGRGRLTGLGSDTEFPGSSGRFQTQIGSALSSVQGTGEEAIISGLLNQIAEAGADRPLSANLAALEMAYQPFIDGLQRGMESAGESLQHAIGQGFDESVISRRVDDLAEDTTSFYDTQIREVRAAANLTRNDPRNAVFALVQERDRIINDATNQLRLLDTSEGIGAVQQRQQLIASQQETLRAGGSEREVPVTVDSTGNLIGAVDAETLAAALQANQEAIAAINTAISGLDNAISQSNDPAEIEQLLQQIAIQIPERYRLLREALQQQLDAGDLTQGDFDASIAQLGIDESAEIERNSDAMLANALLINRQAIEAINVQVAGLENAISQSNDPAEIANLLQQIAEQIPEIYRLRREALSRQFAAGEITLSALQTGLEQLGIEESAALEQNSDAMLSNALRINQQAVAAINVQVAGLENAISQSNDPAEIANLLQQIAVQIPEIYRLKRNALSKQFAAGEITAETFRTDFANLNIEESAALEQNSDAQLANTLRINQEAQTAISTEVSALEQAITTSNDPVEIAALLMQIAEQIPEKYRLKREALQAQFDANEITIGQLREGLLALDTAEAAEFERNSDAQLSNALIDHNADVQLIANNINALSYDIRNSDDPAEIAQLLVDLRAAIMEKFRLQREFLQAQLDAEELTVKQYQGRLGILDNQERQQLGSADTLAETETQGLTRAAQRSSRSVSRGGRGGQRTVDPAQAAQRAADEALATALSANQDAQNTITVEISRLENAISTSNDPAEIANLLQLIAEQIPETYRLRREALQTQFDAGKLTQAALDNGIGALDIEQSAALEQNSDQRLANTLLINQQAVAAINTEISGIENAISQSNDPAEIATLLQQIAEQIPEIYRLRREGLQKQFDEGEITLSALKTGLAQLGIEESAALEQNSDAMLSNALRINQQAVAAINTHIAGLENRISQSNDPVEIATLLQLIAVQIPEIYRLRREGLQKQFDANEITLSTLKTGLAEANIDESAALERNSDAQLANTLGVLNTDAKLVNTEITSLSEQIRTSDDPAEIASLVVDLQAAIMEKYRLQREVLQKQLDAEELTIGDFNAELGSINLAETSELTSAAALGGAETDDLRRTSNALLQNAIQRAQFNLTGATGEQDFETRRQELLRFINEYYDAEKARIDGLMLSESQLRDQQEDTELARQSALRQAADATNTFAADRIRIEEQTQADIDNLRDKEVDNEADRQQAITDLAEDAARRREDIEEDHQKRLQDIQLRSLRSREDIDREFSRDIEDILRESGADERLLGPSVIENFRRTAQSPFATTGLSDLASGIGADLSESDISRIQELARERLRDRQDTDTTAQRARSDANARVDQARAEETARSGVRRQEIEENATATATAIQTALTPLLEQQVGLSPETIAQQTTTAATESVTAGVEAANAEAWQGVTGQSLEAATQQMTAAEVLEAAGIELQSAARVQGLLEATEVLRGAGMSLDDVAENLRGVTVGLGIVLNSLIFATEGFGEAIEDGTLNVINAGTQQALAAPMDATVGDVTPVNIMNTDDIYDPAEIERLRGEGFNNREIGQILRDTVMPIVAPDSEPIQTLDGAVGGGVVNVRVTNIAELSSALATGGANAMPEVVVNVDNSLVLDDGSISKVEGRLAVRADQGLSPLKV